MVTVGLPEPVASPDQVLNRYRELASIATGVVADRVTTVPSAYVRVHVPLPLVGTGDVVTLEQPTAPGPVARVKVRPAVPAVADARTLWQPSEPPTALTAYE